MSVSIRGLPPAFGGYRMAFVTDIHAGPCVPASWVRVLADRVGALRPDLVVFGGDFVSHVPRDADGLAGLLSRFRAPDGAVGVLGNHDHWAGPSYVAVAVRREGVELLLNRHRLIRRGNAVFAVAGVDDFAHGAVRVDEALDGVAPDVPRVLVSHNPDLIGYLPADVRVDLMLAGHTHNGQVHLPIVGPLSVPSQFGGRYLHGLHRRDATWLYVSAGVGTVSVPFRWGNPPELPVIVLEAGGVEEGVEVVDGDAGAGG